MKWEEYRKDFEREAEFRQAQQELKLHFALGDAILHARLAKGWSQSELARRAGTKQANISRIEAGLGNPTLSLIHRLCEILGLELSFQVKEREAAETTSQHRFRIDQYAHTQLDR